MPKTRPGVFGKLANKSTELKFSLVISVHINTAFVRLIWTGCMITAPFADNYGQPKATIPENHNGVQNCLVLDFFPLVVNFGLLRVPFCLPGRAQMNTALCFLRSTTLSRETTHTQEVAAVAVKISKKCG
jgi:hypothetical protein